MVDSSIKNSKYSFSRDFTHEIEYLGFACAVRMGMIESDDGWLPHMAECILNGCRDIKALNKASELTLIGEYEVPKPLAKTMRALVKEGWNFEEQQAWLEKLNMEVQKNDFETWLKLQRVYNNIQQGTIEHLDRKYIGEKDREGEECGKGTVTWHVQKPGDLKKYEGTWLNGQYHGNGT